MVVMYHLHMVQLPSVYTLYSTDADDDVLFRNSKPMLQLVFLIVYHCIMYTHSASYCPLCIHHILEVDRRLLIQVMLNKQSKPNLWYASTLSSLLIQAHPGSAMHTLF